jgi:O-antigen ligase
MDEKTGEKTMIKPIKNKISNINEETVYTWLCLGIVYTMLFWTYLNSILSIILVIFWLVRSKKKFDLATRQTKLMLLFASLYIVGLVGMLYTDNTENGVFSLQKQSPLLFFPLVFGTTDLLSRGFLKKITTHFLIAVGLACAAGLFYGAVNFIKTGNLIMLTGSNLPVFHGFYPGIMGLYCLLGLIIIFYRWSDCGKISSILWILAGLLTMFIFLLSIRLIIFCWMLLVLYFLGSRVHKMQYKLLLLLSLAAVIVISGFTIPTLKKQWHEFTDFSRQNTIVLDKDSSMGKSWGGKAIRIAIWRCSAGILRNHWMTGVGTGDIQDSLQQAYENRKFYFASRYNRYNAHNQYLQVTLGYGISGLLLLLLCIVVPLYRYKEKFSSRIYMMFLLLFVIIGFSESILEVNKGIIWYSFFNSIFAFGYLKNNHLQNLT